MTDSEQIKEIHDDRELSKLWRTLTLDQRREVLKLSGEPKERIREVQTGQKRLFNADH